MIRRPPRRRGATVVECAIVLPVTFLLVLGLIVGGLGIFRYQEVAMLAREGARYASTHGYQYRKDCGQSMGTAEDWNKEIYDNGIKPHLVALDEKDLSVEVKWPDVINQPGKADNWPGSKVEVTVKYKFMPEVILVGPLNLVSKSSMPITN